MASLAERSASPWTATSMRDRPAGCSTCASSLCGALCGNGDGRRRPTSMVLLVAIGRRRGFGAAPAMMVPTRRGATNTTLAATQRHPCRSGMVTAGCARSRLRPETVWRLAALKDQRKIPALTISLTHSRARGADDGGRRRRDASYGVARDSHPVSTTAVRGLLWHRSLSGARARGQRRACEIDLRGARPAPAACAALCVAMEMVGGGRRRWFVGGDRTAARIRRRAGDDGPNAPRRDQHDTRRHPATSVSFWDGDRRLRSVSLAPETVVASGGTEGSAENSRVDHISHPLARARR